MTTPHDPYLEALDDLRDVREALYPLGELARACARMGNQQLASELADIAAAIETARATAQKHIGQGIHNDCDRSADNLKDTLGMVLGATLAIKPQRIKIEREGK